MDRKKAIETVRLCCPRISDSDCDFETAMRVLVPELAESEDERIRRKMVEHFKSKTKETWCNIPVKDIIAHLEKQKEQKPIFRVGDTLKKKGKDYTFTVYEIRGGFYLTECGSFFPIEEQDNWERVEQKPAKYLSKKKVYDIMNKLTELSTSDLIPFESDEYVKIHEITSGVNSLLNYPIEQKLTEWSEEDEEMINTLVDYVEYPSCWNLKCSREKLVAFVKSLRPSWKPSEEQMEALDKAIPVCMGVVARDEITPLESLYEQLKKLL